MLWFGTVDSMITLSPLPAEIVCNSAVGVAVPIPTLPSEVSLIFSAAISEAPVAKTNSVSLTVFVNAASASA